MQPNSLYKNRCICVLECNLETVSFIVTCIFKARVLVLGVGVKHIPANFNATNVQYHEESQLNQDSDFLSFLCSLLLGQSVQILFVEIRVCIA